VTSLLLIAAVSFWGVSFVATKMCLDYLSPAEIIAARFVLAMPVLIAVSLQKRLSFSFLRQYWPVVLAGAIVLAAHLLIQVEGMKTTTATNTAWLITAIPVFIVILSFFFLKERINRRQMLGMAIAAAGVLVLVSRGDLGSLDFIKSYGDWLVLASCVTWAIYTILGKKITGAPSLAVTTVVLAVAAVILVPPVFITTGIAKYLSLPPKIIIALLFLGFFCLGMAYWFWAEALQRKTAGQVGVYLYLEPFSTTLVAPLVLGETVTISLIGGGLLVATGVWLVEHKSAVRGSINDRSAARP
jgi:drug/metabolite transporter (DMT)-like permease